MKTMNNKMELFYLIEQIKDLSQHVAKLNIMEICGTHTMAIGKSGLRKLLPNNIRLISGPGCPVCVTHDEEIDNYLDLAGDSNILIATFGDLLRVPGIKGNLTSARSEGAKVEVVYSTLDALRVAQKHPEHEVVFLGVGFETTAPTIALSIIEAKKKGIRNFSVYSMHKLVPPVLESLLLDKDVRVDGFICPGHVSTIIGEEPYTFIPQKYNKACVITGFEIKDIMQGIILLLKQIRDKKPQVEIQYSRGVKPQGNSVARKVMDLVFEKGDSCWRGFGLIPNSGLYINKDFGDYDASAKYNISRVAKDSAKYSIRNCSCGEILKGIKVPKECSLFKNGCTPFNPIGPCMVSSEGACAAYYRYDA